MDSTESGIPRGSILVADDDLSARQMLVALMEREGYEVRCAPSGRTALMFAREEPPDVMVLDIRLPDMDGLHVCRLLKEDARTQGTPVIFISAFEDVDDKIKSFAAGGVDYISKPFQVEEVLARVKTHLTLRRLQNELERRVEERTADLARAVGELAAANEQLRRESEQRKRAEDALEDRLRFEQMLAELSARFVDIAPERVDPEIEAGLQRLLRFFEVDRCGLLRAAEDGSTFKISHACLAEGIPPVPAREDLPTALFPWAYQKVIVQHEVVSVSRLEEMPPEAAVDQQTYREWGIQSHLNIPILMTGSQDYVISINAVRKECVWPEAYIPRLRLLGEIFVNALERKRARMELDERFRFERLISDLSAAFVNLPPDAVDAEIEKWLRPITEFFPGDRCNIWVFSEDLARTARTMEYCREGVESAVESLSKEQLPWYLEQLSRGEPVVLNRVGDLPPEAERDRQFCLARGLRSVLAIPMVRQERTLGFCALVSVREERIWRQELVQRFRLVGEVFANALAHKQAYQALQRAELEHRTILDFTYDWEYWANPDGSLRYVSPSCERITGYTPWEFIHAPSLLRDIILEEDRERWAGHLEAAGGTARALTIQFRIRRRDGTIRWIDHICRPVSAADGTFLGMRVSNRDITERMRLQEQLRTAAEEWKATFDSVQDPVMLLDTEYRIRRVNAATVAFLDLPLNQILGGSCHLLFHGTDGPVKGCPSAKVLQTLRHETAEVFHAEKSRWLMVTADPIQDAAGNLTGIVHTVKDITERKRAEEALRESEERFRNLADTAPVLIWMSGRDKRCTYFNQQWLHFTGRSLAEELGDGWAEGIHPEERERCLGNYRSSFDRREPFRMEYRLRRADGEFRWVYDEGIPRISPAGEFLGYIGSCVDTTERKQMEEQLKVKLREIEELKGRLERENIYLREEAKLQAGHEGFVGESEGIRAVLAQAERVASTDSTVLILGETGTGKELLAHAIHHLSDRKDRALVTVNCASLPPTLIEAELFGRERGAYTGAMTRMAGRFEVADGSTLFLDEVGELPPDIQAKLLRILQDGAFERLGSTKTVRVNVRLIAATNRDLEKDIQEGRFRKDLYYRLNVFPIVIPPLRERPEDIPLLVWGFVREFEKKMGKRIESIPRRVLDALQRYAWPGNARELRNVIEHAMIVSTGGTLEVRLPAGLPGDSPAPRNLEDVERRHILSILEKTGWRLTGQGGAAELLGLKRTTLQSRMKKLGIKRPLAMPK